jgi:hypothetical protein
MQDPTEATFDPFFYQSSDSGATWTGPILLNLDSIPGITYDPVNGPASSSFDVTMTVDGKGNPHLGVVVLPGSATTPYSVLGAAPDKYIYDITYDPTLGASCQWRAIQLDYINTLRDPIDGATAQLNMDNHLRSSRSPDGHKVFFGWVDSDSAFVGANGDNSSPDYKMVGIDVYSNTKTAVRNFSGGDITWGGQVLWPVAAPVANVSGSTYNIPTVFTQLTFPVVDSAANYFYISNINFSNSDFTQNLDNTGPDITVLGQDTIWTAVGSVYHDTGATAFDCFDGNLTDSIVVTNPVNTSTPGLYTVTYSVHDAAGNTSTATRIVIVATAPICDFTITADAVTSRKFKYIYTNPSGLAVSWDWNYGDGSGKVRALSLEQHRYASVTSTTTYNVLFTARNPIGVCTKPATIVLNPDNSGYIKYGTDSIHFTSINAPSLNDYVSVYPNPASSTASIDLNVNGLKEVQISIVNMMGQRVYSNSIADMSGEQMLNVDVSTLAPGMYVVHIETDKGNAVKKLHVSHN